MSDTSNPIRDAISEAIGEHDVILFMKGTPEQPRCGFSARTVAALDSLGATFAAVDVLPDPRIRQELSAVSMADDPQLFVKRAGRRRDIVPRCTVGRSFARCSASRPRPGGAQRRAAGGRPDADREPSRQRLSRLLNSLSAAAGVLTAIWTAMLSPPRCRRRRHVQRTAGTAHRAAAADATTARIREAERYARTRKDCVRRQDRERPTARS